MDPLIDELATVANHDARLRFTARSARGNVSKALALLECLGDL